MNNPTLKKFPAMLLAELYKASQGLLIQTMYQKHKVELSELFSAISVLKAQDYVTEDNYRIKITDAGISYLIQKRSRALRHEPSRSFYLEKVSKPALQKNFFFLPRLERMGGII